MAGSPVFLLGSALLAVSLGELLAPRFETVDGSLNIRLPRDASATLIRETSVDLNAFADRLYQVEWNTIPALHANTGNTAYEATMAASVGALAATNAQVASIQGSVNAMQGAISTQISTAVADAVQHRMTEFQALLAARAADRDRHVAHLNATVSTAVEATNHRVANIPPRGKVIGFKECATYNGNGADSVPFTYISCTYAKKRTDTILHVGLSTTGRQIYSSSRWRFYVNNLECRGPNNEPQGDIRAAWHGSGYDLHRPFYVGGMCFKTSNNQPIGAGDVNVRYTQYQADGDSFIGWETAGKLMIQEYMPDTDNWQAS